MRITKFGHACVRIEHDGTTIVLDPGVFTDAEAVDGADAVLITHEHADHYLPDNLLAADAPVFTIEAVAAKIREDAPALAERITVVAPGETFEVGGLPVRAVGEMHAVIHPEFPRLFNSGYVVTAGDAKIYHPGDSLTEPARRRRTPRAVVGAVAEGVRGDRVRPRGEGAAQPRDPRPDLQRRRPRLPRDADEPLPAEGGPGVPAASGRRGPVGPGRSGLFAPAPSDLHLGSVRPVSRW